MSLCTQHLVAAYLETVKITLENPAALLYYTLCMSSIPLEYSIIYCKHSFLFSQGSASPKRRRMIELRK